MKKKPVSEPESVKVPESVKIAKPLRPISVGDKDTIRMIIAYADWCRESGWPETSEALFAAGWIMAKEMYEQCSPKPKKE